MTELPTASINDEELWVCPRCLESYNDNIPLQPNFVTISDQGHTEPQGLVCPDCGEYFN